MVRVCDVVHQVVDVVPVYERSMHATRFFIHLHIMSSDDDAAHTCGRRMMSGVRYDAGSLCDAAA